MKLITVFLPEQWIKFADELVDAGYYPNRAELLRIALRDLLITHKRFKMTGEAR